MPIEMTSHTIVSRIQDDLKARVAQLMEHDIQPSLAVVLVGSDPKSELYVSSIKRRQAENLGIAFTIHRLHEDVSEERIIETIEELNRESSVTGIIVQLPLPAAINIDAILNAVAEHKDVDGLSRNSKFTPPTVAAILQLLESYDIQLTEKKIVIVGKGRLVGSPLLKTFKDLRLDVSAYDETAGDLIPYTSEADVLISATGQPNLIEEDMVKDGAVVIDVDCDVDYLNVAPKASYITPQRGGVGPLTVAHLLSNVVEAAEAQ